MAVADANLVLKYSINTGPGNSTAQANPNDSLGGFMSSSVWAGGTLHDLFDAITGDENAVSDVEYRCVFLHNTHATDTLGPNTKLWLAAETAGGANGAVALDGTGVISATSATAQAERVANENTAPTGETFSSPATKTAGIAVPNIPAGSCIGIWIRRSATNSAALAGDSVTIRVEGDTL